MSWSQDKPEGSETAGGDQLGFPLWKTILDLKPQLPPPAVMTMF